MSERSWTKRFKAWLIPFLGHLIVRFLYLSNRRVFTGDRPAIDAPVIVAFWHEYLLMEPFHWRWLRKNKPGAKVFVIASDHKDGEYIARLVGYIGIDSVRGSSTRGGVKALLGAIKRMGEGHDLAFTPDGPRGPRHSVADGLVAAAQKSGAKIVPLRYHATRYWRLKSWDRFIVPKPFGMLTFEAGEPFDVNGLEMNAAKELIRQKLGNPPA